MLLADHRLPEKTIKLRPSMVKFFYEGGRPYDPREPLVLEVSKFADEGAAFLNTEFVQVLAGLGVGKDLLTEFEVSSARDSRYFLIR
jgi:hypothetical protein